MVEKMAASPFGVAALEIQWSVLSCFGFSAGTATPASSAETCAKTRSNSASCSRFVIERANTNSRMPQRLHAHRAASLSLSVAQRRISGRLSVVVARGRRRYAEQVRAQVVARYAGGGFDRQNAASGHLPALPPFVDRRGLDAEQVGECLLGASGVDCAVDRVLVHAPILRSHLIFCQQGKPNALSGTLR